jgi:hypothetical protein
MDHQEPSDRLGTTLEELCRKWEAEARRRSSALHLSSSPARPEEATIALAREAGTQGPLVAREAGRRLGWDVYDHELLERIAQELHWRMSLLESIDEKRMSWLEETVQAFRTDPETSGHPVSESAYVRHLVQTILALGVHGGCIIVGRGAVHILPAATTLRVRLVAPLAHRIEVMSHRLGLSNREAERRVQTVDSDRAAFIRDHFTRDPENPHHYDLILNTARFSVVECADLIVEALRRIQKD